MVSVYTLCNLLRALPCPVFVKERTDEFRYALWNAALEAATGIPEEPILGRTDGDFLPADEALRQREVERAISEGDRREERWRLPGLENGEASVTLLRTKASGDIDLLFGILQETSETATHLEAEIASIIGHDVAGPLHSMHNLTTELLGNLENVDPSAREETLTAMAETSSNLLRLFDDFRDFARTTAGPVAPEWTRDRVLLHIAPAVDILSPLARAKGISIDLRVDPELTLRTDPNRLNVIMRNLLGNSIKFSRPGGRITVTASRGRVHMELSVVDRGIGMTPEEIEKANSSGRIRSKRGTAGEKGTGLGLQLSKSNATRLGATLTFATNEFGGVTATLRLPV
ncbi:MAG: ATP-binding protein [Spirochaetaceae bacterium]